MIYKLRNKHETELIIPFMAMDSDPITVKADWKKVEKLRIRKEDDYLQWSAKMEKYLTAKKVNGYLLI